MINLTENPTWGGTTPRVWQSEAYRAIRSHFDKDSGCPAIVSAIMGAGKTKLIAEICANVELKDGEVIVVSTTRQSLVEDIRRQVDIRCQDRTVGAWYARSKTIGRVVIVCNPSLESLSIQFGRDGRAVALWIADEAHHTECSSISKYKELLGPGHTLGMTATPFLASDKKSLSIFEECIYRYGAKKALKDGIIVPWRIVNWHGESVETDDACISMIRGARGPGIVNAKDIEDAEDFALKLHRSGIKVAFVHSGITKESFATVLGNLEYGYISCVVHVNLLSEGVDLPFLRWMCLRREVGSRVRFVQEVGRLLRSDESKKEAVFYDPHDLFGSFNLSYGEALGDRPSPDKKSLPDIDMESLLDRMSGGMDSAIIIQYNESIIRNLVVSAEVDGIITKRRIFSKAERVQPATFMQEGLIITLAVDAIVYQNGNVAEWLNVIMAYNKNFRIIRYGFAADLIVLLYGVLEHKRWPKLMTQEELT